VLTSSAPLPRWLCSRAARLGAVVVEGVLEVHGHARLFERLADVRFGRALAAALALPDENDLGAVARVLRAGLAHDEARLGFALDPAAGVVTREDGTLSPLFCIDGERVVRLAPRSSERTHAVDVERRLGAALLVAHAVPPWTSEPRASGRGARARVAEALLADLIVGDAASPELLRVALGSAAGEPFGVPVLVYDDVLRALEGMLHRPARSGASRRGAFRLAPLLALHDELVRAEERASRHPVERFVRRELRFARDYGSRTLADRAPVRALPRRPARTTTRPLSWRPTLPSSTTRVGQRELFAP
jgi:hypothetical protein